ncbi:MAG TPA: TonB-dependent receptor, partial [Bryobacteraceae bacterium]|nr:TonB-dependent receptor [Bryobacteraceae bacterium]
LSLLLLFVSAAAAFAQGRSDLSKGSISVEVIDPSGAIIQNATVIIAGPAGEQKATTDLRGQAVFFNLIPGRYKVRVEQAGFRAYESANVQVQAGQRAPISAQMEPGAVTETVQVTDTAATVDTTTTTTGSSINQDTFTNLPVGRNVVSLFSLSPGVVSSGDPTLGASNPSISGATGLENQYVIDGINATDQGYGAFGVFSNVYGSLGTGVNFDFVREVQIKTGGFEAQYGQALGGIVNIVTASGTNAIHGAVYGYMSPTWAEGSYRQPNAGGFEGFAPRISQPQTEVHSRNNRDIGFNIGGPFIHDRLFWYGSFNPSWNVVERMAPPNFGARAFGFVETKTRAYNWIGKLNFNITDNHHLEGTAFGDPSRQPVSVLGAGAGVGHSLLRDDLNNASSTVYGSRNWGVKYNGLLGARTVLAATFGWNRTYFEETPAFNLFSVRNYGKPKVNAAYTWEGGVDYLENADGDNRQYSAMVTQNATLFGGHQIDLGYMYNDVDYNAWRGYSGPQWALPDAEGVRPEDVGKLVTGGRFYLYPSRTATQMGLQGVPGTQTFNNVYRVVRGNFSDPVVGTNTKYNAAFVQDAWQINRYLTAKLGVRWEQQKLSGTVNEYTFAGNWAPRLGFIIDPTGSRKTKIFANWGRFFEKIPQDLALRSMSEESDYRNIYSLGIPPAAGNLVPGTVGTPSGLTPTIIYGGTKSMYQEEIA